MHGPEDFVFGLTGDQATSFFMKRTAFFPALTFAAFLTGCGEKSYVDIPEVARAPDFVSERHLSFRGTARVDLSGIHQWRAGSVGPNKTAASSGQNYRYVIPVVADGWDKSEPVPLWVSFPVTKRNQRQEMGALRAALQAGAIRGQNVDFPERTTGVVRGKSAWQSAVENAEATHGIRSNPRAPIVSWRPRG